MRDSGKNAVIVCGDDELAGARSTVDRKFHEQSDVEHLPH